MKNLSLFCMILLVMLAGSIYSPGRATMNLMTENAGVPVFPGETAIAPDASHKKGFDYYYLTGVEELSKRNLIEANLLLDTAMTFAKASGDKLNVGLVHLKLGAVKKNLGDYALSLENYLEALNIFEKLEAVSYIAICHVDLAEFYRKTARYEEAIEQIDLAQQAYFKGNLTDTVTLIKIYNRSAALNNEYNPDPEALKKKSYTAINLSMLINQPDLAAVSWNELGYFYKNHRIVDSSEYCYLQAERLWLSVGDYFDALHAMSNRAMMYAHNNYKLEKVTPLYQYIIHMNDSLKLDYPLIEPLRYLYQNSIANGDSSRALYYYMKYHDAVIKDVGTRTDYNLFNVNEKYRTQIITDKYNQVSEELTLSSKDLVQKNKERNYLIVFIVVLVLAIAIILFLLNKIRSSNQILKAKNFEKDSLIQEIHHRVKNNLQFISSLVNMQLKTTETPEDTKTLTNASRRINAMALVHEMLYNQSDKQGISIKPYLEELVDSLSDMVNSGEQKVRFELKIVDVDFEVADAISLGMITSELISNSIKHAFVHTDDPTVMMKVEKGPEDQFFFFIKDNGKGFTESDKKNNTLGLRLVDIFARQLKGNYTISGENGFEFKLVFSKK